MSVSKLPKWFDGSQYESGDKVTNPFSGEECVLDSAELSMYDFIIGTQLVMEKMPQSITPKHIKDFHKGLDWFRSNNSKAYMALLD